MIENTNFGGKWIPRRYLSARGRRCLPAFNCNAGGARLWNQPEFASYYPGVWRLPTNVADQLGFGERQGADSAPGLQGRVVLQWQLDKAEAWRRRIIGQLRNMLGGALAIVTAASIPAPVPLCLPGGADVTSNSDGL